MKIESFLEYLKDIKYNKKILQDYIVRLPLVVRDNLIYDLKRYINGNPKLIEVTNVLRNY